MQLTDVLKRPLITEKLSNLSEKLGQYGFEVDRKANKLQIKQAIEKMYGVNVKAVRTYTLPGKAKTRFTKQGFNRGMKQASKRAVVTLAAGETINFYSNV
jgi:large subunit ribosomal protein L23